MSDSISAMLAKWCAEWTEHVLRIGRAMGYRFPHQYEFGFKIIQREGNDFRVQLRMNDATSRVLLRFPTGEEPSIFAYENAMKTAASLVRSACSGLANVYCDKHPDVLPADKAKAIAIDFDEIDRQLADLPPPQLKVLR